MAEEPAYPEVQAQATFTAAAVVVASRELETTRLVVELYRRILEDLREHWQSTDAQELRAKFSAQLPLSAIFPIWDQIYEAKRDHIVSTELQEHINDLLTATVQALSNIEAGHEAEVSNE